MLRMHHMLSARGDGGWVGRVVPRLCRLHPHLTRPGPPPDAAPLPTAPREKGVGPRAEDRRSTFPRVGICVCTPILAAASRVLARKDETFAKVPRLKSDFPDVSRSCPMPGPEGGRAAALPLGGRSDLAGAAVDESGLKRRCGGAGAISSPGSPPHHGAPPAVACATRMRHSGTPTSTTSCSHI